MFRRSAFLFCLTFLFSLPSFAGKLEKGFERLAVFDYFAAKEYFSKSIEDDPAAAAFGLAKIYSVNNNPFYNTDTARKFIQLSDSLFPGLKEKQKKYYSELGVNEASIRQLSESICEDGFQKAQKTDNSESYNHFLKYFSSCSQKDEVIELRDQAAFDEVKKANNSDTVKFFINSYPQALQIKEAQKLYDRLIYEENTDSTIESYQFFIQTFPQSPYLNQAEKMIYSLSVPDKSIDQYAAFARKHKTSPFYKDAWLEVYRIGMKVYSEETYTNFKTTYPDFPFMDELETDYRLQNTFFVPYSQQDLWGYMNDSGVVMIEPQFDEAALFSEGMAVVSKNDKYGFVNKAGRLVVSFSYDDAEPFHNAAAVVSKDSLFGLIDRTGEFIIPPMFDELSEMGGSMYMGVKNGKSGYISRTGDTITGFVYDVAGDFRNGYAVVTEDEKSGLLDSTGRLILKPSYSDLVFISDRFLRAKNEDEYWGIVNLDGDTILPFEYDNIAEFSEGLAMVVKNNKCGYIDESRRLVIPIQFPFVDLSLTTGRFKDGMALIRQKFKSILIDTTGKQVVLRGAEDYGRPAEGFFPVKKAGKWGFMNAQGKITIPCKYQTVESFANGTAVVTMNKMKGVIDTTGAELIAPSFKDIIIEKGGIIAESMRGKGVFSNDGAMIIPCEYKTIEFLRDDIVKASRTDAYEIVNLRTGRVIFSVE